MFCVYDGCDTALFLGFCDGVYGQCCFTGRFRSVNFYYPPFGVSAYSQGLVERDGTGRDYRNILHLIVAKFHNTSFTEVFFYLVECQLQGL